MLDTSRLLVSASVEQEVGRAGGNQRHAMGKQLVGEADRLQLDRLVTEIAWRIDNDKADMIPITELAY